MPGFNICGTGNGPSAAIEPRRKHRWVFTVIERGAGRFSEAELLVLLSASRPVFKFDQPEMHHDQEVAYFAGKQTWEPVTLKWYDIEQDPDVSAGIYNWITTVTDLPTAHVNPPSFYKRSASMSMTDGHGRPTETWQYCNAWPAQVNWGEGDYSQTDLQTIEVTMRFDRAYRVCRPAPAPVVTQPSCNAF